jgi:hypothetical protein
LLWSEVLSVLHEAAWRGDLTSDEATAARTVFASLPIHREDVAEIADKAWRVADDLGLAKVRSRKGAWRRPRDGGRR